MLFRRTGLTLKEGRRDEHGMEEVDGLFSSPEKSPAKLNGFDDENDSIGSDMSIEDGELTRSSSRKLREALCSHLLWIHRQCARSHGLS